MSSFKQHTPYAKARGACLALVVSLSLAACALTPSGPGPSALDAASIEKLLSSPDRSEADRKNDQRRKPAELLAFLNLRRGMTALDLSAGGGYTSELLARAFGSTGKVWGQSQARDPNQAPPAAPEGAAPVPASTSTPASTSAAPPAVVAPPGNAGGAGTPAGIGGPRTPSEAALIARQKALRAASVDAATIEPVVQRFENPVPPAVQPGSLDIVTLMFNYHDLGHMGTDRQKMNRAVFAALRPGGVYVVADHAGRPGTGISESGTLHRIEEAFLRREIEAAGFKWQADAGFLRNPADPRDRNNPVPPQPKDDFIMKFVKP